MRLIYSTSTFVQECSVESFCGLFLDIIALNFNLRLLHIVIGYFKMCLVERLNSYDSSLSVNHDYN